VSFKKILDDLGVTEQDLRKLHNQLAKELGEEPDPSANAANSADDKVIIDIKVEEHQGQLFAFELDKELFIAQGKDGDELIQRILDKYPTNVRVTCDRSNGGELITDAVKRLAEKNG